jgi:hypothetical protein
MTNIVKPLRAFTHVYAQSAADFSVILPTLYGGVCVCSCFSELRLVQRLMRFGLFLQVKLMCLLLIERWI